jgi:hypothetical protein
MGGKCAIHNTQYFSHDVGIAGKQKSKLKREAQYSLPNGLMGQHIINQQGGVSHHFANGKFFDKAVINT